MTPETRAILGAASKILDTIDQRMEPLVSDLKAAYDQGLKTEPFDETRARRWIDTSARLYFIREVDLSMPHMPAAQRVEHYRELQAALKIAMAKLDQIITTPDLSDDFLTAWWEQFQGEGLFHIESGAHNLLGSITALAVAARTAAEGAHEGPGTRKKSTVPRSLILNLAGGFSEATGLMPSASPTEPFAQFVRGFMEMLGKLREENETDARRMPKPGLVAEDTIHDAIKDALASKKR